MVAAAGSLLHLRGQGGATATASWSGHPPDMPDSLNETYWSGHPQSGYGPNNASQPQGHTAPALVFTASSAPPRSSTETTHMAAQLDGFSPRNFEKTVASIKSAALKSTHRTGPFIVDSLHVLGFGFAATSNSIRKAEAKDKKEGTQTSTYYRAVDARMQEEAKANAEEAENNNMDEASDDDDDDDSDALASAFAQIEKRDETNGDIKSKAQRHYRDNNELMNGKGGGKARLKAIQHANVTNRTITAAWRQLQDCAELELRRIISLHMSKELFEMATRATNENAFKAMTWIRNKVYRDKKHAEREAMDTIRNEDQANHVFSEPDKTLTGQQPTDHSVP